MVFVMGSFGEFGVDGLVSTGCCGLLVSSMASWTGKSGRGKKKLELIVVLALGIVRCKARQQSSRMRDAGWGARRLSIATSYIM